MLLLDVSFKIVVTSEAFLADIANTTIRWDIEKRMIRPHVSVHVFLRRKGAIRAAGIHARDGPIFVMVFEVLAVKI